MWDFWPGGGVGAARELIAEEWKPVGVVVPAPWTGVGAFGSTLVTGVLFLATVLPAVLLVAVWWTVVDFAAVADFAAGDLVAAEFAAVPVAGFFAMGFFGAVAGGDGGVVV